MSEEKIIDIDTFGLVDENESEKLELQLPKEEGAENIEDKISLTMEEERALDEFMGKIDLHNTNHVLQYGSDAQNKMAEFSDAALEKVRTRDLGDVGDSLSSLVSTLHGFSALEEKKGLSRLFHKALSPIEQMKNKFAMTNTNVEKVTEVLEGHQVELTKDVAVLDELFKANYDNFKQLSMYIVAGKRKLKEETETTLEKLRSQALFTKAPEDAQEVKDYEQKLNRFEKKLYDLDLTRTVALQMAPQIRLIQNNDSLMIEKIQTAITSTIPLWKSQMVLALGLANSKEAMEAQQAVSNMTNELLKKNAEVLKDTTLGIARESERGVVDIETLQETNQKLIETIDEVMTIQEEGREKRREAEEKLYELETELKNKMLETRSVE